MSDLVERLRRYKLGRSGYATQCHRAADEIERKDAAIAELLAALKYAGENGIFTEPVVDKLVAAIAKAERLLEPALAIKP